MTAEANLERRLTEFFSSEGSGSAPIDLHATSMAGVARARQRPTVLVRLRGERLGRSIWATPLARMIVLAGAALILLVMAAVFAAGARHPAASGTITYVEANLSGSGNVWSVRADGTGDHEIGPGECPSISANGASMVFMSGRLGNVKGQMIAAKGDGSEQHVLPGVDAWTGAVSPDGSQVAWAKEIQPEIYGDPANDELWVSPVSGSPGVRIVPRAATPNVFYRGQAWSPHGDQIAFVVQDRATWSATAQTGGASIWIVNADGSKLHQLVTASPDTSISWSPDGRWLAYVRDAETSQLMAVAADGSVETLVGAAAIPDRVRWSPNGRYLAFLGDGIGTVEMSEGSPVGAPHRVPAGASTAGFDDIAWSPDSHDLLIVETRRIGPGTRPANFASRLLSIDPEFQGAPTLLFDKGQLIGDFQRCPVTWSNP